MVATEREDQSITDNKQAMDPVELYTTARETLRSLAELISECGSGTQPAGASAPSTSTPTQNEIYSSILVLKNAHRLLCENLEAVRERTQGVRSALRSTSLKLENLRYQERHYQREIRACRDFTEDMERSLMGDGIELVSEADYRRYIDKELEKDRLLRAKETEDAEAVMMDHEEGDKEEEEDEEEEGQVEEGQEEGQEEGEEEGEEEGAASENEDGEDTEMVDAEAGTSRKKRRATLNPASVGKDAEGGAQDHAHMFKLGRLHYEVERRKLALEQLAALKSERDAIAAEIAKRHTISSDISSEVAQLKAQVEKRLAAFEGGGQGSDLNVHAPEFQFPG